MPWPTEIPKTIEAEETGVLDKDIDDLNAALQSIAAQIDQKTADTQTLAATINAQQALDDTLDALATMRKDLFDRGSGSKADWLNALAALKAQQVALRIREQPTAGQHIGDHRPPSECNQSQNRIPL